MYLSGHKMDVELTNDTSQIEFYILAFSTSENGRIVLLISVLLIYLIVLTGNLVIITLVCLVPQLHTSMYFFLCNLSILDILYVTTTLPKLLHISHTGDHTVSYTACIAQLYLFLFFADTESFLLTTMAFDRYVAVCFPLHYSLIMSKRVCISLALPAWIMAAFNASILTCFVSGLTFFNFSKVNNFFCDLKALIIASFSDTTFLRKFIVLDGMSVGAIPLLLVLTSYVCIIYTILKIQSSVGRRKTFSSCSSHLTMVVLYYGSSLSLYMQYSQEQDKLLSMMFVTLVPMLNPLVYSLRNKDILSAMKKIMTEHVPHTELFFFHTSVPGLSTNWRLGLQSGVYT
ncbi:olfactory receptor 2D2-like [Mixophyes fleayi]|uniref:olfactory receptor 2D2-like n=1 Tax=Mixophyes fleayi TaxID=3061075 RepID=UPI003F4DD2E0